LKTGAKLAAEVLFAGSAALPFAAKAGTFTTLHVFGGSQDGGLPWTGMVYLDGQLYGATVFCAVSRAARLMEPIHSADCRRRIAMSRITFNGGLLRLSVQAANSVRSRNSRPCSSVAD
jgi:hypothetical protein